MKAFYMPSKKPSYPAEFVKRMLKTVNKMSVTTLELAPPTKDFVEFSSHCKKPVLDIGCGFGVSSLAALNMGASVIAFNLAQEHLRVFKRQYATRTQRSFNHKSRPIS